MAFALLQSSNMTSIQKYFSFFVIGLLSIVFPLSAMQVQDGFNLPYPENHDAIIEQAYDLNVPMRALYRAMKEAESETYARHDVIAIFDISKPSNRKRFFVLDLKNATVAAYHASHGQGNGPARQATRFRGFSNPDLLMTPLGALKTGAKIYPYNVFPGFEVVHDPFYGTVYRDQKVLYLKGTRPYQDYVKKTFVVVHTKNYATRGFRAMHGQMGRSHGCIALDPEFHNQVIGQISGGSLLYITVGDNAVENYL